MKTRTEMIQPTDPEKGFVPQIGGKWWVPAT